MLDKLSGCPSDHRTFILDVDTDGLWKAPLPPPPTSPTRGFTSANKPRTTAFIQRLDDLLTNSNFHHIIMEAQQASTKKDPESVLQALLDQADEIMTSCMLQAQQSIMPSKKAPSHPWSPALVMAQRKKGLVSNLLSALQSNIRLICTAIRWFLRNA